MSPERAAIPPAALVRRAGTLRVFGRYLVFQVPGWAVVGGALLAAIHFWQLPERVAWLILALFVTKDLALFPVVRRAYEPGDGRHVRDLVGCRARASDPLAPRGYVRVGGELWRAELSRGGEAAVGAELRVVEVRGMTLIVDPVEEEPTS